MQSKREKREYGVWLLWSGNVPVIVPAYSGEDQTNGVWFETRAKAEAAAKSAARNITQASQGML